MVEHKGHDPSTKKLKELRSKGQVFKCPLLAQSVAFLLILVINFSILHFMWSNSSQMIEYCLSVQSGELENCGLRIIFFFTHRTLFAIGISLLATAFVANLIEILQIGLEFHWGQLAPSLERISLVEGLKRQLIGLKSAFFIAIKLALILLIVGYFVQENMQYFGHWLEDFSATKTFNALGQIRFFLYLLGVGIIFIALFERQIGQKKFINQHSMSLEEVRREHKQEEGDPHLKAHRRAIHEEMALQEIEKRVRSSTVIIVDG